MLTTGLVILITDPQIVRNIDPDEALRYFSWTRYIVIAVVYTACVFWIELAKDGPFIFSSQNARSKTEVLQAHAMYLVILFCCFRMSIYFIPRLPFWITDNFNLGRGSKASIADFLLCVAAYGMAYFERKWLHRDREATIYSSENSPSNS